MARTFPFTAPLLPVATLLLALPVLAAQDSQNHGSDPESFTLEQILQYPYAQALVAADHMDTIAWVSNVAGVRNIWAARAPAYTPMAVTHYTLDDGQEITQLNFTPDATHLIYVRGGDHDANWPAPGQLAPDPASSPRQPQTTLWGVSLDNPAARPIKIGVGDAPAISAHGQLAYIRDGQVWSVALNARLHAKGTPQRLFFDRGTISDLEFSPDGSRLAFVSHRDDHAFIGIFTSDDEPLLYLAPSTGVDDSPRWSPDGAQLAFVRRPGQGGAPAPFMKQIPHPWSIWTANAHNGEGHAVWESPDTLAGSYPEVENEANLYWAAGQRLVFLAYLDDWPHLYSIPAAGGTPLLLTPGEFMVEHVAQSRDRRYMIYDANTGDAANDSERRHLFKVAVDHPRAIQLTHGEALEYLPVSTASGRVAYIASGVVSPPAMAILDAAHPLSAAFLRTDPKPLANPAKAPTRTAALAAPWSRFVVPQAVTFQAPDGLKVRAQLFERAEGRADSLALKPGIIFVHGGPQRQMLLGWHYMDYYGNAYAVNQYLAGLGFVVLSINYRLGIGYGLAYQKPEKAGASGSAEYQDVLAGARFLQAHAGVDAKRVGIWGGSYGGLLTALALARNSDVFKAGVDLHGVHDWSRLLDFALGKPESRYEQGDRDRLLRLAFESSPDASVEMWKSPVLLVQGDDDRNVPFQQTIDLARRLNSLHVPYEELVLPNEIHSFLRYATWLQVDKATVDFFTRHLLSPNKPPPSQSVLPSR